jgi:hypothetical protein
MSSLKTCNMNCGSRWEGRGRVGSKGWAVDHQPGTSMDGHSHHDQQKRDFQVSKKSGSSHKGNGKQAQKGSKVGGSAKRTIFMKCCTCMYHSTCVLASNECCVKVINKPCVREARYMHLISWTRHRGSKQSVFQLGFITIFLCVKIYLHVLNMIKFITYILYYTFSLPFVRG